jgi:hypothetical protein
VLGVGLCSQDVDCEDDNVCTKERCVEGKCKEETVAGSCKLAQGGVGTCADGLCEPSGQFTCLAEKDCPARSNDCGVFTCQNGVCVRAAKADAEACQTKSGRPGRCLAGTCTVSAAEPAQRCRVLYNAYFGYFRRCTSGLAFSLSPEKLAETEHALEKQLLNSYRYDYKVALVELPGGGYNIIAYNRRTSRELAGLSDPSFIAWQVADFTQNTNWKSRNLEIWLKPYSEGWGLATEGSRDAVRHGREHSQLGWLGVLDAPSFRQWLERTFRPLPVVPMGLPEATPELRAEAPASSALAPTGSPPPSSAAPAVPPPARESKAVFLRGKKRTQVSTCRSDDECSPGQVCAFANSEATTGHCQNDEEQQSDEEHAAPVNEDETPAVDPWAK